MSKTAFALTFGLLACMASGSPRQERINERVLLSNGETAEVSATATLADASYRRTYIFRDNEDQVISATFIGDFDAETHEMTLRGTSPKEVLSLKYDLGFQKAGLKTPLVVRVGTKTYRALITDTPSSTDGTGKIKPEVAKLPGPFLAAVRRLYAIADGGSLDVPPMALLDLIWDQGTPDAVTVTQRTPLTEPEVASLQSRFTK